MMLKKIRQIKHDEKGSLYILMLVFVFLIICIMLIVSEVIRVHDLKEHIEDEIYRASNLAIKTAMYDSYRIDSASKFDDKVAVDAFYSYLTKDLGLDSNFTKNDEQGSEAYRLVIDKVNVNGETVRMNIKAMAYAKPAFNLWKAEWEIPIDILSRNMRTD